MRCNPANPETTVASNRAQPAPPGLIGRRIIRVAPSDVAAFRYCDMTQHGPPSMVFAPMSTAELRDLLGSAAEQADEILATLRANRSHLPVAFPGLPRRFGKDAVGGGQRLFGEATVDLDAFRICDLVAAYLVTSLEATEEEIVDAIETDTVFLNRHHRPGLRAIRTERSERLEREEQVSMAEFGSVLDLYFGGDMESSIALSGQVVGRIDEVKPVAEIFRETVEEFRAVAKEIGRHAG